MDEPLWSVRAATAAIVRASRLSQTVSAFRKMSPHGISRLEVVLAESLDRFSRDQEDTAGLFKRLTFAGVNIVTPVEGDITHLQSGSKGR